MSSNTPDRPDAPQTDPEAALVNAVTRVLDQQAGDLDGHTRSRLTQARAAAMAARANQRANPLVRWWRALAPTTPLGSGVAAVALVGVLVVAPLLLMGTPGTDGFTPVGPATVSVVDPVDELEIVLAGDIEMLEDLEFFEWLATQPVG